MEYITAIVRHVLTTLGGLLVAKGVTDEATVQAVVGGLVAAIGLVWSLVHKKKAADAK